MYGSAVSIALPSFSTPRLASVPKLSASCVSSGIFFRMLFRKSIMERLNCFFAGRNASPISIFSAVLVLFSMVSMASGVCDLMLNSRSMLPVYRLGSLTISSAFLYTLRLLTIFAPPSMAHWPNRVDSAATCRSCGRSLMALKIVSSVPTLSSCMALATHSALMPSSSNCSFWAFVALAPLLKFTIMRLMLVPTRSVDTPVASMASASAAVVAALTPPTWPRLAAELTASAISAAVVALFAPR